MKDDDLEHIEIAWAGSAQGMFIYLDEEGAICIETPDHNEAIALQPNEWTMITDFVRKQQLRRQN